MQDVDGDDGDDGRTLCAKLNVGDPMPPIGSRIRRDTTDAVIGYIMDAWHNEQDNNRVYIIIRFNEAQDGVPRAIA